MERLGLLRGLMSLIGAGDVVSLVRSALGDYISHFGEYTRSLIIIGSLSVILYYFIIYLLDPVSSKNNSNSNGRVFAIVRLCLYNIDKGSSISFQNILVLSSVDPSYTFSNSCLTSG